MVVILVIIVTHFQVLHPYLGISWFKKLGGSRADQATIIFEHAFLGYKAAEPPKSPPTPSNLAKSSTTSSFLDDILMNDIPLSEDGSQAAEETTESKRFLDISVPRGDPNKPLLWWKVSLVSILVLATYLILYWTDSRSWFSYRRQNGARFPCYPRNECFRGAAILQIPSSV